MLKRIFISFITAYFVSLSVLGQDVVDTMQVVEPQEIIDSLAVVKTKVSETAASDTVAWVKSDVEMKKSTEQVLKPFKPSPKKAVLYSAIFPGLGQIYNRKYWKLPIVYGGFIGLTYAISWNGKYYNDYTDAYRAIMSEHRFEEGYIDQWKYFIRTKDQENIENITSAQLQQYQGDFKRKRDYFRRNRDLSIIGAVALYALCMIDAYVDAELFDFDISPDLTFRH